MRLGRVVAAIALVVLPLAAHADPVTLVVLVSELLVAGGYITVATAAWIAVGAAIYGTVEARQKQRAAEAAAKAAYNATLSDRSVTTLTAEPPWRIIYGRCISGGDIVAVLTSDKTSLNTDGTTYTKHDAYKHVVIVVAAHQVQAINEVYINGVACGPLDVNGWVTTGALCPTIPTQLEVTIAAGGNYVAPGPVIVTQAWDMGLSTVGSSNADSTYVAGSFTVTGGNQVNNTGGNSADVSFAYSRSDPSVRLLKHLGTATQTVDAAINALVPTQWLASDRLQGLAYVIVTLDLTNQQFQSGPPQITIDTSGRLVSDPRSPPTSWNPSDSVLHGSMTIAFTAGNSTATYGGINAGTPEGAVRGSTSKAASTGKWYFEILLNNTSTTGNSCAVGICGPATLSADWQVQTDNVVWCGNGQEFKNAATFIANTGVLHANGVVFGAAVDTGAQTVQFYKNNVAIGASIAYTGTPAFPYMSDRTLDNMGTTLRTTLASFTYTPPAGYAAWDVGVAWSSNPALCIRDFLTNVWGMGCLTTDVDDAYTIAAANACDVQQPLVDFINAALVTGFNTAGVAEGWVSLLNCTVTVAAGVATVAATGATPQFHNSPLASNINGTINFAVRIRFHRNAGSGWLGRVLYSTSGHGESLSFYKQLAEPTYGPDGYAELTFDMSALTVGGTDWVSNSITGLRFDLGNTATDSFNIDWIVVGPMNAAAYTCNGVYSTDSSKEQALSDMAQSMAGYATYGAKWLIQAGAWTAPVMTLTDDDLFGQIEVAQGGVGMDEVFNTVRGSYIPQGQWTVQDFDPYIQATYVAADGLNLYTDLTLAFTDNKARAKNLAALFVERNRLGQILTYPAKLRAWPLQIGDRVTVNSLEYGLTTATYRVTDWQFDINGAVILALQQDASTVYGIPLAPTMQQPNALALPNPWVVSAPTGVTVTTSGVLPNGSFDSRAIVAWTPITDAYLTDGGGYVKVRWRRQLADPANLWTALPPVPASNNSTTFAGLRAADVITVEVVFENGLGALSIPVYVTHTVVNNSSLVTTPQIDNNAATAILTDVATTPFTVATTTPISRNLPAAGTYEITVSGRISCTAFTSLDMCQVWFSNSGTGSFIGDGNPSYAITINGQILNFSQTLTVTVTGAGPWQVNVNVQRLNGTATLTMTNLVMRTTQIKK